MEKPKAPTGTGAELLETVAKAASELREVQRRIHNAFGAAINAIEGAAAAIKRNSSPPPMQGMAAAAAAGIKTEPGTSSSSEMARLEQDLRAVESAIEAQRKLFFLVQNNLYHIQSDIAADALHGGVITAAVQRLERLSAPPPMQGMEAVRSVGRASGPAPIVKEMKTLLLETARWPNKLQQKYLFLGSPLEGHPDGVGNTQFAGAPVFEDASADGKAIAVHGSTLRPLLIGLVPDLNNKNVPQEALDLDLLKAIRRITVELRAAVVVLPQAPPKTAAQLARSFSSRLPIATLVWMDRNAELVNPHPCVATPIPQRPLEWLLKGTGSTPRVRSLRGSPPASTLLPPPSLPMPVAEPSPPEQPAPNQNKQRDSEGGDLDSLLLNLDKEFHEWAATATPAWSASQSGIPAPAGGGMSLSQNQPVGYQQSFAPQSTVTPSGPNDALPRSRARTETSTPVPPLSHGSANSRPIAFTAVPSNNSASGPQAFLNERGSDSDECESDPGDSNTRALQPNSFVVRQPGHPAIESQVVEYAHPVMNLTAAAGPQATAGRVSSTVLATGTSVGSSSTSQMLVPLGSAEVEHDDESSPSNKRTRSGKKKSSKKKSDAQTAAATTHSGSAWVFQLSASLEREYRTKLAAAIEQLGGVVEGGSAYHPGATHLVVPDGLTERTEKYLSFRGARKRIVSPRYVMLSAEAGAWLSRREWEFDQNHVLRLPPAACGLSSSQRALPPLPFSNWKVVLFAGAQTMKGILRILAAGGCRTILHDEAAPARFRLEDYSTEWFNQRSSAGLLGATNTQPEDRTQEGFPEWMHIDPDAAARIEANAVGSPEAITHVIVEMRQSNETTSDDPANASPIAELPRSFPDAILDHPHLSKRIYSLELLFHVLCTLPTNHTEGLPYVDPYVLFDDAGRPQAPLPDTITVRVPGAPTLSY